MPFIMSLDYRSLCFDLQPRIIRSVRFGENGAVIFHLLPGETDPPLSVHKEAVSRLFEEDDPGDVK